MPVKPVAGIGGRGPDAPIPNPIPDPRPLPVNPERYLPEAAAGIKLLVILVFFVIVVRERDVKSRRLPLLPSGRPIPS